MRNNWKDNKRIDNDEEMNLIDLKVVIIQYFSNSIRLLKQYSHAVWSSKGEKKIEIYVKYKLMKLG